MKTNVNLSTFKKLTFSGITGLWKNLPLFGKFMLGFTLPAVFMLYTGFAIIDDFNQLDENLKTGDQDNNRAIDYLEKMDRHLENSSQSLGFYLLSKEESHKNNYIESIRKLNDYSSKLITDLQPDYLEKFKINTIAEDIKKITDFKEQFLNLAVSNVDNYPAMLFATKNVNPMMRNLTQLIELMVLAEETEEVGEERKQLLKTINSLRITWNKVPPCVRIVVASFSVYLIS
jgi:methyl-accepting chemotaxis protein